MSKRTGSLIATPHGFRARLSLGPRRITLDLGTNDSATARRALAALIATIKKGGV